MPNKLLIPPSVQFALQSGEAKIPPGRYFHTSRIEHTLVEIGAKGFLSDGKLEVFEEQTAGKEIKLPVDLWKAVGFPARKLSITEAQAAFSLLLRGLKATSGFEFKPSKAHVFGPDIVNMLVRESDSAHPFARGTICNGKIVLPALSFLHEIKCSCGKALTVSHGQFLKLRGSRARPICESCPPQVVAAVA